jgi:hypothetical protein
MCQDIRTEFRKDWLRQSKICEGDPQTYRQHQDSISLLYETRLKVRKYAFNIEIRSVHARALGAGILQCDKAKLLQGRSLCLLTLHGQAYNYQLTSHLIINCVQQKQFPNRYFVLDMFQTRSLPAEFMEFLRKLCYVTEFITICGPWS